MWFDAKIVITREIEKIYNVNQTMRLRNKKTAINIYFYTDVCLLPFINHG